MDAASSHFIPKLVSTLLFTFVLVVLYIWVKHFLITLLCLGRQARLNVTPNRYVAENRSSIEDSDCADSASPSRTGSAKIVERNWSEQRRRRRGTHPPNAQNESSSDPPSSPDSTTTLTRHFGWPLEPMRIEHDPSNRDAGGLVEGSGIHLQLYINATRTIITGGNFSAVAKTGERAESADAANADC